MDFGLIAIRWIILTRAVIGVSYNEFRFSRVDNKILTPIGGRFNMTSTEQR